MDPGIINGKALAGYLLFAAGVAILFALGLWQLMRGLEKADIEESIASATAQKKEAIPGISQAPVSWRDLEYRTVSLNGRWLPGKIFLLDNRLFNGRSGYEVLSPFELTSDASVVLVNRGWLARPGAPGQSGSEQGASVVTAPVDGHNIQGEIYLPQKGFTLGETYQEPVQWPLPVLYYDFDALSAAFGQTLQPAVLVLSANSEHSFRRIWQPANMPAARHYGYALQWWGLTLTLIIFGIIWRRIARRQITKHS